jgi:hypothetical protein
VIVFVVVLTPQAAVIIVTVFISLNGQPYFVVLVQFDRLDNRLFAHLLITSHFLLYYFAKGGRGVIRRIPHLAIGVAVLLTGCGRETTPVSVDRSPTLSPAAKTTFGVRLQSYPIPVAEVHDPEVNRLGTEVVFVGIGPGYGTSSQNLFVYTLETGAMRQLSNGLPVVAHPTWSPDGTTIAFNAYPDGGHNQDIWIVDAAGGTPPTQVVTFNSHEQTPTWSPQGDMIAFSSDAQDGQDIWIVEMDSPNPPYRLNLPTKPAIRLCWTSLNTILYRAPAAIGGEFSIWEILLGRGSPVEAVPSAFYPGWQDMASVCATIERDRLAVPISSGSGYELWLLGGGGFRKVPGLDGVVGDCLSPSWTSTADSLFFAGGGELYLVSGLSREGSDGIKTRFMPDPPTGFSR